MMFYVIDKNTGEPVEANGFWAVGESGQLYDVMDGWGCEGGGGSSNAPTNFIAVFGQQPDIKPKQEQEQSKIPCEVCGKQFKTFGAMNDHRNMKHFLIGAKPELVKASQGSRCSECGDLGCNGECYGDDMMGSSS